MKISCPAAKIFMFKVAYELQISPLWAKNSQITWYQLGDQ